MTTQTKSTQPAVINPRNTGMKWQKLGMAKDPKFKTQLFLCNCQSDNPEDNYYSTGFLKSKTEKDDGSFKYEFTDEQDNTVSSDFTHYCEIKPPVD